jgi:hypothetical protein
MTELKRARANRGRNLRNLIVAMAAVLGLLMLAVRSAPAAEGKKRRVIPVTINKGETYTISGLKKDSATKSKPVKNPNSLTVQPQPSGDVVLLGTEGGSWKIDATLASGEKVTYDVKVKADAPPINSLVPGTAPTAIAP